MPANRFYDPFVQKFNSSTGSVGAGWKLYFYVGGSSTTLQDTYSDTGLSVPNTNPVVADGSGFFGDIFLDSSLAYACKLTDANDVQIDYAATIQQTSSTTITTSQREVQTGSQAVGQVFTLVDFTYSIGNVQNLFVFQNGILLEPGASADYEETSSSSITVNSSITINPNDKWTFLKNVAASTTADAANVTYTPAGSGAVATNVQAKLRESKSLSDFGAVGDGVTDDTSSVQAAIDDMILNKGYLFLNPGTYLVDGLDLSGAQYCSMIGPGQSSVIFKATGNNKLTTVTSADTVFCALNLGEGASGGSHPTVVIGLQLSGFTLDANGQSFEYGLYQDRTTDSEISHIEIKGGFNTNHLINYSWINDHHHMSIKDFVNYGVDVTNNNVNACSYRNTRNTASVENSVCWRNRAFSMHYTACDAEGSATIFTGWVLNSSRINNLYGCHMEGGTPMISIGQSGTAPSVVNINGCLLFKPDGDFVSIDTVRPEQLNITGCTLEGPGTVNLDANDGIYRGNYSLDSSGTATITTTSSWEGSVYDDSRKTSSGNEKVITDSRRIGTMSTSSGAPTPLISDLPVKMAFDLTFTQRLSSTNVASVRVAGSVDEAGTLRSTELGNVSTALGLTLSWSAGTLSGYATSNSAAAWSITVTQIP